MHPPELVLLTMDELCQFFSLKWKGTDKKEYRKNKGTGWEEQSHTRDHFWAMCNAKVLMDRANFIFIGLMEQSVQKYLETGQQSNKTNNKNPHPMSMQFCV